MIQRASGGNSICCYHQKPSFLPTAKKGVQPLHQISSLLSDSKQIVIVHHYNPDADALGSSLGLYHYLQLKGHRCTVVSPNAMPTFLMWMPDAERVLCYEEEREDAQKALLQADIVFCLDLNHFSRTRIMEEDLRACQAIKVVIDHHLQPDEASFDFGYSDSEKSSTCEMVYDFILAQSDQELLNVNIAQCLYAGAMTDTGSFKFPSTTASVHRMVADFMERGLNPAPIHQAIFDTYMENRLRFLGHALSEKMKLYHHAHAALIAIPKTDLKRFEINTGDTEGIVNYPLSIGIIVLSIFITERDQEIRMSFRSKGSFDVNAFARQYFNGGGHKNAAGGRSTDSLSVTIEKIEDAIQENKNQLIQCYNELPY
jgi:phosphoesterase RecJ-like protein